MIKKLLAFTFAATAFSYGAQAQCPANDSTIMGAGNAQDVFYSLANHTVTSVANSNWHLAFSVQPSKFPTNPANGVAIRVNSGVKSDGGTTLSRLDNASAASWRSIDTTGLYLLPQLLDSDSTWELSAFTKGYTLQDAFNFKWGTYSQSTHNVTGTGVYVLYNSKAGWYKKIFIKECTADSAWNFIISNIDNTDSSNVQFDKRTYANKLFAYYNVLTDNMIDREPVKTGWDLLWTKYVTYVTSPMGSGNYTVTSVLSNPAVTVEQNDGKKCDEVWLINKTSTVNPRIDAIGHDWKFFNGMSYVIADTFVYFIKGQDGKTYKMTFKSFSGSATGKSTFNVYEATTDIKSITAGKFSIYPNPATGLVSIDSEMDIQAIDVIDMQGKTVYSASAGILDLSGLARGMYVISIQAEGGVYHQQVIKE